MTISKNSIIGMSVSTFLGVLTALWVASGTVQGYLNQQASNTAAIAAVVLSLDISRVDRMIQALQKERRELKRRMREEPDNGLLHDQLEELNDAIEYQSKIRECVINPELKVCQ